MRFTLYLGCLFALLFSPFEDLLQARPPAQSARKSKPEQRKRKPVLIRADREEQALKEQLPVEPDPDQARKSITIGDFYFKRENYKAAQLRYEEAIRYHAKGTKAYRKLVRVLEKQLSFLEAAIVCEDFVDANPESNDVSQFQDLAKKLRHKAKPPS